MKMQKDETAETGAHALLDLIEYQTESIVSRVLMQTPQGNVTLFAIFRGQKISEHTTPFDAMVTVLEGEAEIIIGGTAHRLVQGEMIVMPGGIPHAVGAMTSVKMILVMIKN